jgi:hypothetical protein
VSATWRIVRMTGGSRTINHPWIAVAPGCPTDRHPTRDCGCKVHETRDAAAAYVVSHGGTVPDASPACASCGRPMRPIRASATDHPGTVMHKGRGLCSSCHSIARQKGSLDEWTPERTPTPSPSLVRTLARQGMADRQIAERTGSTTSGIAAVRRRHGIEPGALPRRPVLNDAILSLPTGLDATTARKAAVVVACHVPPADVPDVLATLGIDSLIRRAA